MKIKEAFSELESDIKTLLPDTQLYWDSQDLKFGIRLTLEYLGFTKNKLKFYLKILGGNCFDNKSFIDIAELECLVISKLPFREPLQQKYPRKLESCSYFLTPQDEIADREKKETINYTRRFLLICEIGKV